MKNHSLTVLLFCSTLTIYSQDLKDFNIQYMMRGYLHAKSAIKDSAALGGFGPSDNSPEEVTDSSAFPGTGLVLKIDTSVIVPFYKDYKGYTLFVVNNYSTTAAFSASDSRLYIIAEIYLNRQWQPIEYLPSSWCGNSYHTLYLPPRYCWKFSVPKYNGSVKTKLRYRLANGNGIYVYSNEIPASINPKQLFLKQDYVPSGIMDPYKD